MVLYSIQHDCTVINKDNFFSERQFIMDRRQQKTRMAIFSAFGSLLSEKPYSQITIQAIIDRADIGRSTFYSHFQTKDDLLSVMCMDLFQHIIDGVMNHDLPTDHHMSPGVPDPVFCHILQHIESNSYHVRDLLLSESSDIFLKYFKQSLNGLIQSYVLRSPEHRESKIPDEFLLNHISGSFVEMVQWWVKNRMKYTPEELDSYFRAVIYPII